MYEMFEHTADLGLRIVAPDLDALFAEAGQALFAAVVEDPTTIQPTQAVEVHLPPADLDDLLYDFLQALLVHFDGDHLLFCRFSVAITPAGLRAVCHGEPYDPVRHPLSHEVKAITYHGLRVEQVAEGWLAEVIVDI